MTKKQQSQFWSFYGLFCLNLSIAFWLATQGEEYISTNSPLPVKFTAVKSEAAIYGIHILGFVFFTFLYVSRHLSNLNKKKWLSKLPVPFNLQIDVKNKLDRKIKLIVSLSYLIIPMISIVHMESRMLKGTLIIPEHQQKQLAHEKISFDLSICKSQIQGLGCIIADDWKSHLFNLKPISTSFILQKSNLFQYDSDCMSDEKIRRCKGISFIPFFQPWTLVFFGIFIFFYWCYIWWLLFKRSSSENNA